MLPEILRNIPFSTIFIFSLALAISLCTSLANRLLTDPEKLKAWRKEIAEWNSELQKARKEDDKKRIEKLMKKQQHILQIQAKMSWQTTKVMLLFFVPLVVMWQILGGFYGSSPVAYLPGIGASIPIPLFSYSLIWWYMMCSFLFNLIFSHLLGLASVSG
ncbi:MAG: EMC3/TMCO1 family protein [Candidatus Bathycorpusculaceae bacterium]